MGIDQDGEGAYEHPTTDRLEGDHEVSLAGQSVRLQVKPVAT